MIVCGQRVDGVIIWDWVAVAPAGHAQSLAAIRPPGGRRLDPTRRHRLASTSSRGTSRAPKRPLRARNPWRASNSSSPSTPRSGPRGGGAFRGLRARPKRLEPAQTNRHPAPNCPNFSRRFWSQVHDTPAYQKALDWRPEHPLVQWSEGMTARSAVQPGLCAFRKT
jgi:hypothetical protein